MSFDSPIVLAAALAVLLALGVASFARRALRPALLYPVADLAERVRPGLRRRLRRVPTLLRILAVILVAAAWAGPRIERGMEVEHSRGIDIQLVLDVSSTMKSTRPFDRPRYEVVTDVLERFVAARPDDRVGLITFARYPKVIAPLTTDHDALLRLLAEVRPVAANSQEDQTAIGVALAAAVDRLRASEAPSRVIVLFTDGQNNVYDVHPREAAEVASAFGVRVYTVLADRGHGPRELEDVARTTGGEAFVAGDVGGLARVVERIDALEKGTVETRRHQVVTSARAGFTALALLLLALEACLEGFWLRRLP